MDAVEDLKTEPLQLDSQVRHQNLRRFQKMSLLISLLYFAIFLYNMYNCEVTREPLSPMPIFSPARSIVTDDHTGSLEFLSDARDTWSMEHFVVVMYYAAWCYDSMTMKNEFSEVAMHMRHEVKFYAVNCWIGKCRSLLTLTHFPQIFVIYKTFSIEYPGKMKKEALLAFIKRTIQPYTMYKHNNRYALPNYDHSLIFYSEINKKHIPGLKAFYEASLNILKYDDRHEVSVKLITNRQDARQFSIRYQGIYLVNHVNQTKKRFIYTPSQANFTSENILQFTYANKRRELVSYIAVRHKKSIVLSSSLLRGPTLIVFHEHIPSHREHSRVRQLLRWVAYLYKYCHIDVRKSPKHLITINKRLFNALDGVIAKYANKGECTYTGDPVTDRYCVYCNVGHSHHPHYSHHSASTPSPTSLFQSCTAPATSCRPNYWSLNTHLCTNIQNLSDPPNPMYTFDEGTYDKSFVGLSCAYNNTINFVEMNLYENDYLLYNMGLHNITQPIAVIVDVENESTYKMNGSITQENLQSFIRDFHAGHLQRFLRSEPSDDLEEETCGAASQPTGSLQHQQEEQVKEVHRREQEEERERNRPSCHPSLQHNVYTTQTTTLTTVTTTTTVVSTGSQGGGRVDGGTGGGGGTGGVGNGGGDGVTGVPGGGDGGRGGGDVGSGVGGGGGEGNGGGSNGGVREHITESSKKVVSHRVISMGDLVAGEVSSEREHQQHSTSSSSDSSAPHGHPPPPPHHHPPPTPHGHPPPPTPPHANPPPPPPAPAPLKSTTKTTTHSSVHNDTIVQAIEINARSFQSTVIESQKDVVVYYYSEWCGFCKHFSVIYLDVIHHFKNYPILFTRIKADRNDLPWQYTVKQYPTLIYFKSDGTSHMYPDEREHTSTDVITFIYSMRPYSLQMKLRNCDAKCSVFARRIAKVKIRRLHQQRIAIRRNKVQLDAKTKHKLGDIDERIAKINALVQFLL